VLTASSFSQRSDQPFRWAVLATTLDKPVRRRATDFGYFHIFGGEAKVTRKHERGAPEHRDIKSRASRNCGYTDLAQRSKQLIAIECGHAARPVSAELSA